MKSIDRRSSVLKLALLIIASVEGCAKRPSVGNKTLNPQNESVKAPISLEDVKSGRSSSLAYIRQEAGIAFPPSTKTAESEIKGIRLFVRVYIARADLPILIKSPVLKDTKPVLGDALTTYDPPKWWQVSSGKHRVVYEGVLLKSLNGFSLQFNDRAEHQDQVEVYIEIFNI